MEDLTPAEKRALKAAIHAEFRVDPATLDFYSLAGVDNRLDWPD